MNYQPGKSKRGGARPGAGRKPFQPTESDRALVQALAGAGFSQVDIASQIGPRGIDKVTLEKHFAFELQTGAAKVNGICVTGIVRAMQKGEAWALCFWAKTRMGFRETNRHEVVGDKGGPVQVAVLQEFDRAVEAYEAEQKPAA